MGRAYDISLVGTKLTEIKPAMQELANKFEGDPDKTHLRDAIRAKLIECIREDDLPKAIAIVDWTRQYTNLSGKDLVIDNDNRGIPSITGLAYEMGNRDFGLDLVGANELFKYDIEEE